MKKQVVKFDCPYADCIWPRCRTDYEQVFRYHSCGVAITNTKDKLMNRLEFKPKPKKATSW